MDFPSLVEVVTKDDVTELIDKESFVKNYLRLPHIDLFEYNSIDAAIEQIETITGSYIREREVIVYFAGQPHEMTINKGKLIEVTKIETAVTDDDLQEEPLENFIITERQSGKMFGVRLKDDKTYEHRPQNHLKTNTRVYCRIGFTSSGSIPALLYRSIEQMASLLYYNRDTGDIVNDKQFLTIQAQVSVYKNRAI